MKTNSRQEGLIKRHRYLPIIIVCAVCALASYLIGPERYVQRIILLILLWAAATSGFNIISGYGGQIVFGYMMFVGTGAYTAVLLFKFLNVSPWLGMWIGVLFAVFLALFIGIPTLRLRGVYFAMGTIAFPLITSSILNALALEEVPIPYAGYGPSCMQFADNRYYVLIASIILGAILITIRRIENSYFGFKLKALKENETAAEGLGINVFMTKLTALAISGGIGAIVGTIYGFSILFVLSTHAVFGLYIIVRILSINILGGLGTLWGPVIASGILVPVGEFLNSQFGAYIPGFQDVIYGAGLVVGILFMPKGIWEKISKVKIFEAFSHRPRELIPVTKQVAAATFNPNITAQRGSSGLFELENPQLKVKKTNNENFILEIESVSKSFGGVTALRGMSTKVTEGKILGIIGPNGAGKTTLFNIINGYLRPEDGRIIFKGKDITYLKPNVLCRMGIGRTFQIAQIFHNMTVFENIMIGAFLKENNIAKARAITEKIVTRAGLASRANDYALGLSIWETKMLEFSRALAAQPTLLLVDEPMAGLNPEETDKIGQIIKEIAKAGVTVIVIEHVVHSLLKIADRMMGLDEGRKVADGRPEEVIANPHIVEAYLGTKWKERYVKR